MTLQPRAGQSPAIAFEQVGLTTPDGRVILDHVSLQIAEGSTTALLGRSGSGKTTLLRMVNRLIEPTAGRVMVEAKATTDWDPIALAALDRLRDPGDGPLSPLRRGAQHRRCARNRGSP